LFKYFLLQMAVMGNKSQTGSRRSAARKYQKSPHEKAKIKTQKHRADGKYLQEESSLPSAQEVVEKTLGSLSKLGSQTFALSPFSQYFDDWLVNLREVLFEFESNPAINVDDEYVKARSQILTDAEGELATTRLKESALESTAKALSEKNHHLVELDAEYASKTRENGLKRNNDVQRLTRNVHNLEEELAHIGQLKTSLFGLTKKSKAKKESEATQKLQSAKNELELAVQNFTVEQEKLHDEYEKTKQAVIEQVQSLEKEIESLETDASLAIRQAASKALVNTVNTLFHRKMLSPKTD
jgi:hypothetical protein